MSERRVLLIVGGGVAAYKALELARLCRKAGGGVRPILTAAGAEFVTPLSLAALCEDKVYADLFSLTDQAQMGHIELSRSADLVVVAPATADLMAKAANGLAGDLASTTLLATDKPVLMAPAMNVRMWLHAATQRNLAADVLSRAKLDAAQLPLLAPALKTTGPLELDRNTRRVCRAGQGVEVTAREFDLLAYLMEHQGEVLTRDRLLNAVWGLAFYGDENNLEVYVHYLRLKLGDTDRLLIQTVRGVGYRLAAD